MSETDRPILNVTCPNPECRHPFKMYRPDKPGIVKVGCPKCKKQFPMQIPANAFAPADNSGAPAKRIPVEETPDDVYRFPCPHCGGYNIGLKGGGRNLLKVTCPKCKGNISVSVDRPTPQTELVSIGNDTSEAIMKSMLSVGLKVPHKAVLLSTGTARQKASMLDAAQRLHHNGFKIYATSGTHQFLNDNGIPAIRVYWPSQADCQPQALELLHNKEVDLVLNIPKNLSSAELSNGYKIRRAAIDLNIPLLTNARLASAFINAFTSMTLDDIEIRSWDEY